LIPLASLAAPISCQASQHIRVRRATSRLAQFGFSSLEFSGTSELESSRDAVFDFVPVPKGMLRLHVELEGRARESAGKQQNPNVAANGISEPL